MNANQSVKTPLGAGVVQGRFAVLYGGQAVVTDAVIVRLPINDSTRPTMKQSSCLTPRAEQSGLWVFAEEDVK